jgi:tRNA modification GTPase
VIDATDKNTNKQPENNTINVFNKKDKIINMGGEGLFVSALKGDGIDLVMKEIIERLQISKSRSETLLITEARQQNLFLQASEAVARAKSLHENDAYSELVLEELNTARRELLKITGVGTTDDILNTIFSSFCIGK